MRRITIDFETFWSTEFTLSKMPTQAYVNDPQFEVIGFAYAIDNEPFKYVSGWGYEEIAALPWDESVVIMHNASFDGVVLETHYQVKPYKYFCTAQAARALISPLTGSASLAKCAEYYKLPAKGTTLINTKGRRLAEFTQAEIDDMAAYCIHDAWLCRELYDRFAPRIPPSEQELIDLTIKKATRPLLMLDADLIDSSIRAEDERRTNLLLTISPDTAEAQRLLNSNPQFAAELTKRGVVPPKKMSLKTGRETFAFSKKDNEFLALMDHPDPDVQALIAARLGTKSTLDKTRLEKFRLIAKHCRYIGVPLLYYGAGTGRFSGSDGLNMQNLSKKSALRAVLVAPPGYKVVAGDLSQIECRLLAGLAGQTDLLRQFAEGRDVYSEFASRIYNKKINADDHPNERFVGKCGVLQLGYQSGALKFTDTMNSFGVPFTLDGGKHVVATYRRTFQRITELWATLHNNALPILCGMRVSDTYASVRLGPVIFGKDNIYLPNGMRIQYPFASADHTNGEYSYVSSRGRGGTVKAKMYGGMLAENICQALARIVLSTAEIRLARAGLRAAMNVHDELVFVVRDEHVSAVSRAISAALTAPVSWMPDLPLACTVKHGQSYKEAK